MRFVRGLSIWIIAAVAVASMSGCAFYPYRADLMDGFRNESGQIEYVNPVGGLLSPFDIAAFGYSGLPKPLHREFVIATEVGDRRDPSESAPPDPCR